MQDTDLNSQHSEKRAITLCLSLLLVILSSVGCIGFPQSVNPYLYTLRAQAQKGDAEAQYRYGWRCQVGRGVRENRREALWWYRQAAQKNHAMAEFRLGEFTRDGIETRRDPVEAWKWFQLAVWNGVTQGNEELARMEASMRPQELKEARERAEESRLRWKKSPSSQSP